MIRQSATLTSAGNAASRITARVVTLALFPLALLSVHQTHAASDPLDGRLGGTYASFIERFGEPTGQIEQVGVLFDRSDTRYVAVQFSSTDNEYEPSDPALVITVRADRDEARPASEVDPADWTWATAQAIANDLLPTDVVLSEVDESVAGTRSTTCRSEALLEAFGTVTLGECRVSYVLSSDDTVSVLTLTLTAGAEIGPDVGTPEPACAGVVQWAEGSAGRLEAAQTALDQLATLSDDPAVAVPDLRALATDLHGLADEQRSAETPKEIATANYYIIGALTDFAEAVDQAADGLEQGDQAIVDDAVDDLDAADARAERASTEVESAVAECDLTVGTPEAG